MSTERDELAKVIYTSHRGNTQVDLLDNRRLQGSQLAWARLAADTLIASGWRKVPNSEEDIERAAKAVYDLDGRGGAWETRDEEIRELYREDARAVAAALGFPATVLHDPEAAK